MIDGLDIPWNVTFVDNGFYVASSGSNQIYHYSLVGEKLQDPFPANFPAAMTRDNRNNNDLWISNRFYGVGLYGPNGNLKSFTPIDGARSIIGIAQRSDGRFYLSDNSRRRIYLCTPN